MSPRSNRKPALGQPSTLIKHVISMSYKLEPATWSRDTGQRITWFNRCQLIITWCHLSKKQSVNQGCMSPSTYYLEHGRHVARLHRRRRRRRARQRAIPLSMIIMRKSIHGFPLLSMGMGLRLAAFCRRSSAIIFSETFCRSSECRTSSKLWHVVYLLLFYDTSISWLNILNGKRLYFSLAW